MRLRSLVRLRLGVVAGSGVAATGLASAMALPKPEEPHDVASRRTDPALAHTSGGDDPHLWLEQIEGESALEWCRQRNAHAIAAIGDPKTSPTYHKILAIADSQDKIPYVGRIGESDDEDASLLYNFWQDAQHVRGVWRRTSMASYRTATPSWEEVLSLDALNAAEGRGEGDEFVWHGEDVLDEGPGAAKWDRALLFLSPGGTDATIVREFDLATSSFVPAADGGFATLKAEKCDVGYRRRDEVLIGTDFDGTGDDLTTSGYPRVVKSWKRGTPLASAVTVFEVEKGDIAGAQYCYHDRGCVHEFQLRSPSFYTTEQWHRTPDLSKSAHEDTTPFTKVPVPDDASIGTFGDQATLMLRSAWAPPKAPRDDAYPAGSLLVAPLQDVLQSDWSRAQPLFVPDDATSLQSYTATRNYLVLETSKDVRSRLSFWRSTPNGWREEASKGAAADVPVGEGVGVSAVWPKSSDALWMQRSGFLAPASLELASAADGCARRERLKQLPAFFAADGLECTQHFATSTDGTKVPYFQIGPKQLKLDGTHPTLLDGYGGFEISELPYYSGSVGVGWLTRGGVKVVANIRGGGEYGPRWHQAALREKRHRAYEDFEAVAADLIQRGVTAPEKLGCIGGSNGGLLVGNMLTRRGRELFGAAVCQVPLLDMSRYHFLLAGASWMEEYGDPEAAGVWEGHLAAISPYHRLRGGPCAPASGWPGCPTVLFTTSTRDDRVHPGHARKMVRALLHETPPALGGGEGNVFYWENIEGGHGGAADNKQRAYMWALTYDFLWRTLTGTLKPAEKAR